MSCRLAHCSLYQACMLAVLCSASAEHHRRGSGLPMTEMSRHLRIKSCQPGLSYLCMTQDVAAALEGLAKDIVMAVASVPRMLEAQPLAVRTEAMPKEV